MKKRKTGVVRISRGKQHNDRQIKNIKREFPDVDKIVTMVVSGAKVIGYKDFEKVIAEAREGDTFIFDSVSRMSRNADKGCELYEQLFKRNIDIVFLKEPHINTSVYRQELNKQIEIQVQTGNKATDKFINAIIEALNEYTIALAKEQVRKAFEQAEKELDNIHKNTSEGLQVAKEKGKRVGTPKGTKLTTKKSIEAKEKILKHYKLFGSGTLNATETMKLAGIDKNTFYKYKRELLEEHATNIQDTV